MAGGTVMVAEASDPIEAGFWVDALRAAGVEAASFERSVGGALGGAVIAGFARYPVLVAEDQFGRARSIIAELAGAGALAAAPDREAARERHRRALTVAGLAVGGAIVAAVVARIAG